jgi:hypothetical protein
VGWLRARSVEITIDPESHTLTSATSAWGLVVLAALYLARQVLSSYVEGHSQQWQLSPVAVGDATLLFALGAIVGRRIEIFLRSLDLLRRARSGAAPTAEWAARGASYRWGRRFHARVTMLSSSRDRTVAALPPDCWLPSAAADCLRTLRIF